MRKIVLIIIVVGLKFVANSQQKFMLDFSAGKEVDLNSSYFPYTFSSLLKVGKFYVEGNYKYNNLMRLEHQIVNAAESYGGKIGILRGSESNTGFNHFGFSLGFSEDDRIKRIGIDEKTLYPFDLGGKRYEIDKVFIHTRTQNLSLGFKFISYSNEKQKDIEEFADEFDMKFLRRKNIYTLFKLDMELLVASKIDYDTSIIYSPYGFFIPKDLFLKQEYKNQRVGFLVRAMYTPYMKIGFSCEVGTLPGIKFKTGTENDLNLTFKFGAHINVNYATKK
jgi:hypothetical protein